MQSRDYRDVVAGGLLIALGLFAAHHAGASYRVGTFDRMGPGMFPVMLGLLLAGLGVAVVVPALFRRGVFPRPETRAFLAVLLGVVAFALVIDSFGMVPAIVVLTFAAAAADDRIGARAALVIAAALSVFATLVFRVGLSIQVAPFKWPF